MEQLVQIMKSDVSQILSFTQITKDNLEKLKFEKSKMDQDYQNLQKYMHQEKNNYEIKITEINNHYHQSQQNYENLKQENSSLKFQLNERDQQIIDLNKTLDTLNYENQQKQKSMIKLERDLQGNIVLVKAENDRLIGLLFNQVNNMKKQIDDYKNIFNVIKQDAVQNLQSVKLKYEKDKDQMATIIKNIQGEKIQFQDLINGLKKKLLSIEDNHLNERKEKERLARAHQERQNEVEVLHVRFQNLEKKREEDIISLKDLLIREKDEAISRKERDLKSIYDREKQQKDLLEKQLRSKVMDLENQNKFLTIEVERLKEQYDEIQNELNQKKNEFFQLEEETQKEREELLIEFEEYKKAQFAQDDLEARFKAERTAYETDIMQLRQKLDEAEGIIQRLKSDNHRLTLIGMQRTKQIEEWKNKFAGLGDVSDYESLKRKFDQEKKEKFDAKEQCVRFQAETHKAQGMISQLRQELEHKKEEVERQYELIAYLKDESTGASQSTEGIKKDLISLKMKINTLEGEKMLLIENISNIKRENEELYSNIKMLREQNQKNEEEIKIKNNELKVNIAQLDEIKMKYEDALNSQSGQRVITSIRYTNTSQIDNEKKHKKFDY